MHQDTTWSLTEACFCQHLALFWVGAHHHLRHYSPLCLWVLGWVSRICHPWGQSPSKSSRWPIVEVPGCSPLVMQLFNNKLASLHKCHQQTVAFWLIFEPGLSNPAQIQFTVYCLVEIVIYFYFKIFYFQKSPYLTHWHLNEIPRDPSQISWCFLRYFRASPSAKIYHMRSNHKHKIRFQDYVYIKSNKLAVRLYKNIDQKSSNLNPKPIWKQDIK